MTYGVQRMTFTGNTLCDKLKAEFGERTAVSLNLGREANARRAARNTTPSRPVTKRSIDQAVSKNTAVRQPRGHMSNTREFAAARKSAVTRREAYAGDRRMTRPAAASQVRPAQSRANTAQNRRPNIMRDTVVHKMAKPHTDKTPLEISVATFSTAYRRGEKVREYATAERVKPHARPVALGRSAKTEKKSIVIEWIKAVRNFFVGEKTHAEVKVKKTPFPVATVVLIFVCSLMVGVMINSFAQLNEYRSEISALETKQSQLRGEHTRLNGLVEAKEDVRVIEQTATEELGMVSSDLVSSRFVSLTADDRVELNNNATADEAGAFSTLLSAIGENLGKISDYFN